jgi:hypothetical protein
LRKLYELINYANTINAVFSLLAAAGVPAQQISGGYWSSNEYSANCAWFVDDAKVIYYYNKSDAIFHVRAVRSF